MRAKKKKVYYMLVGTGTIAEKEDFVCEVTDEDMERYGVDTQEEAFDWMVYDNSLVEVTKSGKEIE